MADDTQERQRIEHHVSAVVQGLFQRSQMELVNALVQVRMVTEERDAARAELAAAQAALDAAQTVPASIINGSAASKHARPSR